MTGTVLANHIRRLRFERGDETVAVPVRCLLESDDADVLRAAALIGRIGAARQAAVRQRGEEFFMYCLRRVHRHPPVRPFARLPTWLRAQPSDPCGSAL